MARVPTCKQYQLFVVLAHAFTTSSPQATAGTLASLSPKMIEQLRGQTSNHIPLESFRGQTSHVEPWHLVNGPGAQMCMECKRRQANIGLGKL